MPWTIARRIISRMDMGEGAEEKFGRAGSRGSTTRRSGQ